MSHLLSSYSRVDLEFERGDGCWLYTASGEAYLDFVSGVAVNSLGHVHPVLLEALTTQAHKLWHVSNVFSIPEQERLACRFCALTFSDVVFFTNSGAEAVECALKMARKYFSSQGMPERYRIITFEGAFHGRTLATLAAGGKYLDGFGPVMSGFDQVVYGDVAAVSSAITPETAALLIEPIQGEGGVRVVPPDFLRSLRRLADEHGLLLIFDEVQCGMGRTGKLFAHEWDDVYPDIMAIAKGIGGGFPLGACLSTSSAASGMTPGSHGSTYGGNPLAMAVGNAVLDVIGNPDFLARVKEHGSYMRDQFVLLVECESDIIEEVRGLGLMLGLKCKKPSSDFVDLLRAERLLAVSASANVVRFLPPLIVSKDEIDQAIMRVKIACGRLRNLCL